MEKIQFRVDIPIKKKGDFQYYAKLPESKTKPNSSPTVPGWMVYILFQPHQLIRIITVAKCNAMVNVAGYYSNPKKGKSCLVKTLSSRDDSVNF